MRLVEESIIPKILNAKNTTYLTHNFHPYSAKFIPQLPSIMMKRFTKEGEKVMDPFCGSGTALVEAKLLNRESVGIDLHPIGTLMSKVKTTKIPECDLNSISKVLSSIEKEVEQLYRHGIKLNRIESLKFPNWDHWFQKNVLYELVIIKDRVMQLPNGNLRDFLLLGLSAIIVQVSNQESETRYAAINKNTQPFRTFKLFRQKVTDMIRRMGQFNNVASNTEAHIYQNDSRFLDFVDDNSIDFVVTSPPYPNTYDYYLYHKLRMFILGFDVKKVQKGEIGSRHKHSSKKEGIASYLSDVQRCFEHFGRILKPDRYFVIVVGDSIIRGKFIDGLEITKQLAEKANFEYIEELSYSLNLVSRAFNSSFRNKTKKEHIILLKNIKEV